MQAGLPFQMFPELSLVALSVASMQNGQYSRALAGAVCLIFSGVVLKKCLKIFQGCVPDYVLMRPKGAFGCNSTCKIPCEGEVGMPSVHAMMAGYYSALFHKNKLLLMYLMLVPVSRLGENESPCFYHSKNGCHTIPQIVVGYIIGLIIGINTRKMK